MQFLLTLAAPWTTPAGYAADYAETREAAPAIDFSAYLVAPSDLPSPSGKVVLVNFWASWCGPCRAELPLLDALQDDLDPARATVLTVNIDAQPKAAQAVVDRLHLDLPVVFDPGTELTARFDPPAMPSTYLLDQEWRIIKVYRGEIDGRMLETVKQDIATALQR